jgi:hypothetical protein
MRTENALEPVSPRNTPPPIGCAPRAGPIRRAPRQYSRVHRLHVGAGSRRPWYRWKSGRVIRGGFDLFDDEPYAHLAFKKHLA